MRVRLRAFLSLLRMELMLNLRTRQLLALMALFSLAMVGGAYGLSGLSVAAPPQNLQTVPFIHPFQLQNQSSRGIVVFVSDIWGSPRAQVPLALMQSTSGGMQPQVQASTNATGFGRFSNVGCTECLVRVGGDQSSVFATLIFPPPDIPFAVPNITVDFKQVDLNNSGSQDFVVLHMTTRPGSPAAGASVTVNGTRVGYLSPQGFILVHLAVGRTTMTLSFQGSRINETVLVLPPTGQPGTPLKEGPTAVLFAVAFVFSPALDSMVGLAVAHGSWTRERVRGGLEVLLSRPLPRGLLGLGKLTGLALSVCGPVVLVSLVIVGVIAWSSPQGLDGTILLGFLGFSCFLVFTYLCLQSLASLQGKFTLAALWGFVIWLVFNLLWGLVTSGIVGLMGLTPSTPDYYRTINLVNLASPTGTFELLMLTLRPGAGGGGPFLPATVVYGIAPWQIYLAGVAWAVVPAFLVLIRLRRLEP